MHNEMEEWNRTATDEIEEDVGDGNVSGKVPESEIRLLLSAYEATGRFVTVEKRVERARRHVLNAEILRKG